MTLEQQGVTQMRRFQQDPRGARAHLFGRVVLTEALAQPSGPMVWLRFGLDEQGEHAVLTAGAQDYNFTNPCPPTCPPGSTAQLLGTGTAPPDLVERVGAPISAERARSLTSAFAAAGHEAAAGLGVARADLERLLLDPSVHGLWFASGRRESGERSVVLLPAGARGELVPVPRASVVSPASYIGALGAAGDDLRAQERLQPRRRAY